MRFSFLSIFAAALALFSGACKKDQSVKALPQITGIWELQQEQSGMIPTIEYPAGNNNYIRFTETAYEKYRAGSLLKSGTYALETDTTVTASVGLVIPSGQFTTRLIFDGDRSSAKTFIDLRGDKLLILSGYFPTDGGSSQTYQRRPEDR